MPLHHAVLALLAARPAHGYELKTSFEQAVGDQWGGLNIGHLYQILDRLSRDGLIDSERQPQQVKPDRIIHRLTPACRAELHRWLAEPAVPARGYRDDFFLKVMAAVRSADPAVLPGVLSRQRACLLRQLHALAGARGTSTTAVDSLLITAAELHIRADLGIIDAAEKTLTAGPPPPAPPPPSPGSHHRARHPPRPQRVSPQVARARSGLPAAQAVGAGPAPHGSAGYVPQFQVILMSRPAQVQRPAPRRGEIDDRRARAPVTSPGDSPAGAAERGPDLQRVSGLQAEPALA